MAITGEAGQCVMIGDQRFMLGWWYPTPHISVRELRNFREASRPRNPLLKPPPGGRGPIGAFRHHPHFQLTGTTIYQLSVSLPRIKLGPAETVTGDPAGRREGVRDPTQGG